jgi:hypothetical protein
VSDAEFRAAGGIGAFVAGALRDASVFAGVKAGVVGLPAGAGDFNPATITSLTVKGLPGLHRSVVNSNIAATDLGKVSLRDLETENNGAAFGIATRRFKSITLVSATGSVKIAPIVGLAGGEADGDPGDDFVVKVI